jgi:hypothetical protein
LVQRSAKTLAQRILTPAEVQAEVPAKYSPARGEIKAKTTLQTSRKALSA